MDTSRSAILTASVMSLALALVLCAIPVVWDTITVNAQDAQSKAAAGTGKAVAKLQTSETLRSAMEAIRYAVVINHTLVTHRRMPPANARQFEADINAQTARIKKSDGLSKSALATIAPILQELEKGAAAIGKSNTTLSPMDGLIKIDEALENYEREFFHPGWKGLQEL